MKITGKNSLSYFIEICSIIVFIAGITITLTLPLLLKKYIELFNPILNYNFALIILYLSSVSALIIVYKFIQIFILIY